MAGNMAARTSWLVALKAVGGDPLGNVEPPKPKWGKLIRQTVFSFGNLVLFSLAGATILTFIEGQDLQEVGAFYFENAFESADEIYTRFLASLYIITTTVTTVGYGDIVPYTAGGKWFVMLSCTIGFVADIVCILRMSELVNACMTTTARKIYRKSKIPSWFNPSCLLSVLVSLAIANAVGWMFLTRANGPSSNFPPWSFTDACWFSWATFTTVGFGDFSPASSGHLNILLLIFYLLITLLGLAVMTSLIESMVEFVTDVRATKEAAKLAGVALKKSRKTVADIKSLTMTPARHLKNLGSIFISSKRNSKIHPELDVASLDSPRDVIPSASIEDASSKLELLSKHEGKAFLK